MTYVKKGPFQNNVASPALSAAFFDGLEKGLTDLNGFLVAPAPSGDTSGVTDQAALQPLITQAQASGGTVWLQPGNYYVTGLSTTTSFNQPRIQGPGRDYCIVHGTSTTTPVFRFKGGSGAANGGGISDVQLTNPGGTCLQIADATSTTYYRIVFDNSAVGVQFLSESTRAFCEFNVVYDSDFHSTVTLPVWYARTSGNESFHGSGIAGNTTINQSTSATKSMIQVDAGCVPYQSPLEFTGFPKTTIAVINNQNNGGIRAPQFYGSIKLETIATNVPIGGGYRIHFDGIIEGFGSTGLNNGTLIETEKTYYNDGGVFVRRKPWVSTANNIGSAPTVVAQLEAGIGHLIDVTLVAPNYAYRYLLWVSSSPYDGNGSVTVLGTHTINNTAGYGGATWLVSGGQLYITGSGYPSSGSQVAAVMKLTATGEFNIIG